MSQQQIYEHDGGLFSFQLPSHWSHVVESDGTQVFWDDAAGSGTLRVTSLTATKQASLEAMPQLALLESRGSPQLRKDGVAWCHYCRTGEEEAQPTVTYWWEFANFVPPCFARLAFFSFTIYADEADQPATVSQLEELQSLVDRLKFGSLQAFERQGPERGA